MKIGFTGSRKGMTQAQTQTVLAILDHYAYTVGGEHEFHHGDCIGSDFEAQTIAWMDGYRVVVHPPENPKYRAWCKGHESREAKPYTVRDQDIVDETELLIATPRPGSRGTWTTVGMALKTGKPHVVVPEDGTLEWSNRK